MISTKGSSVMAIDLSHLPETGQVSCKRRHSQTQRHFAKSISTDGSEGKLTKNIQETDSETPIEIYCISEETNETVSNFLKCLSDKGSGFFGTSNYQEPEDEVIKRIGEVADGVFQVSDLHESGGYLSQQRQSKGDSCSLDVLAVALRRSQSTGDLGDSLDQDHDTFPYIDSDHHSYHCNETPEKGGHYWRTGGQRYSADAETDGQETPVSDSVSVWNKGLSTSMNSGLMPSNSNNNSGGARRNRPRMVRQNHIDIDSDSSESKSHLLPWNTNTLPLPSKKHKEKLTRDVETSNNFKIISMENEPEARENVKSKERNSNTTKHRKYSLGVQTEKLTYSKEKSSHYNTLPHPETCSKKGSSAAQSSAKGSNVQKRRRKSHGLTIKIESPTTGEDSSAGIIDTATLETSPSNIYLSGVSISRGHSPLPSPSGKQCLPVSSPEGRHSRSPSLSMPPASPVAINSRVRSASLAVSSYTKTPPHSPGCLSLAPNLSPFRLHSNLCHFNFGHSDTSSTLSQLGSLTLHTGSSSTLSSVLHIQDANLSSDDFHEAMLLNKLQKTPKKRKKSKKSRSNSKDLTLN